MTKLTLAYMSQVSEKVKKKPKLFIRVVTQKEKWMDKWADGR